MAVTNDFRHGDGEHEILRKSLNRLGEISEAVSGGSSGPSEVTLTVSDIEIGAVELKDASSNTRAKITASAPAAGDEGLVVRNIPSGTQPVSAATLPLPAGAATEATLATRLSEAEFQARINTLGQKTMANSTPVAIASDQTLACPIGAATETTLLTRLSKADFEARINVQGQNLMANSTPVVIASDQSAVEVQASSWPLPAGAATEATLATRLSEAAFQARINTLGQKTMANSTPVVISSDQSTVTVVDDWRLNSVPKRYSIAVNLTPGAAAAGTNLLGLRKLNANADVFIIRIRFHVFHAAAGVACVLGWRRATTVAGGSLVTAADIPKHDSSAANATLEVRTGAVTGTEANQYIISHPAHTTAAPAASVGSPWIDEWKANDKGGRIRLTGDEGLILEQITAGDTDNRYHVLVEWEEA